MQTIAFVNRKGGVGKSTSVMHLGIRYAQMGRRVLLVDVDPQASLSQGLLGRDALALDPQATLASVFDETGVPLDRLAIGGVGGRADLDLVPAHERMGLFNHPAPWEAGVVQFALRDALDDVAAVYDLCLLDCPPSIQLCGWSALLAADGVVIPAQLEDFGIQGVQALLDSIESVRAMGNPSLRLLGILPTMFDKRLSIHQAYRTDSAEAFGADLFAEVVSDSVDFKMATTLRQGISEYKPRGDASKALCRVADEVLARLAGAAVERFDKKGVA